MEFYGHFDPDTRRVQLELELLEDFADDHGLSGVPMSEDETGPVIPSVLLALELLVEFASQLVGLLLLHWCFDRPSTHVHVNMRFPASLLG
jgi:hypothetical protein